MRRIAIEGERPVVGEQFRLSDEKAHYLINVLRCEAGELLELFDGEGNGWVAELVDVDPATVEVRSEVEHSDVEPTCDVTLYQAVPKRDRFEWLIEKATELGVRRIVPLETRRSVVRIPADRVSKKLKRWEKIAAAASRQSQRLVVPEISAPARLADAVDQIEQVDEPGVHLFGHPDGDRTIGEVVAGATRVGIWVGPEGGFSDEEVALLSRIASKVTIGPRMLRSETAGVVSVALVQEHTGGLGR